MARILIIALLAGLCSVTASASQLGDEGCSQTQTASSVVCSDQERRQKEIANDILIDAGMPRAEVEAMDHWDNCTSHAIDLFADQPEPARTVAEAAMASCVLEKAKYMIAIGVSYPTAVEEAAMPRLLARVMAIRAARVKAREVKPEAMPTLDRTQ